MRLRYQTQTGAELESQPGSRGRVLRNRLGIVRKRAMDQAEFDALVRAQTEALTVLTADTRFTAALLCQLHQDWLGEIYDWAGRYRTVEVSKDDFTWPPAARVAANMESFEKGLLARHTPCRPEELPQIAQRLAEVHAELLFIHPFREGNGRLARWLADLMALQAGLPAPAYPFTGPGARSQRARYLTAVQQGYLGRYAALTAFFEEALRRGLAEAGEFRTGAGGGVRPDAPSNTEDA